MVAEMLAKGVDHEVILLAVSTAEQIAIPRNSVESAEEKRKRKDRERKRLSKEIPGNSTEIPRNAENAPLSSSLPVSSNQESKKESKREANRGSRLPDDWQPSPEDRDAAIAALGAGRAADELAKFRDHWKAQPGSKGVKSDWQATWRNWYRRAVEYGAKNNGRRTVHDAARDLHENLLDRIAQFDEPAPRSLRSPEGSDVVRLLPARGRE
jgi:hypothetical protein